MRRIGAEQTIACRLCRFFAGAPAALFRLGLFSRLGLFDAESGLDSCYSDANECQLGIDVIQFLCKRVNVCTDTYEVVFCHVHIAVHQTFISVDGTASRFQAVFRKSFRCPQWMPRWKELQHSRLNLRPRLLDVFSFASARLLHRLLPDGPTSRSIGKNDGPVEINCRKNGVCGFRRRKHNQPTGAAILSRQQKSRTEFIGRSKKVLKYQEKCIENKLAKWNTTHNGGGRSAQYGFRDYFAQAVGAVGFDKWQSPSDNPHRRLQNSKWTGRHGSRTNPAWIVSSDYPKSHLKASATSFR